MESSCDASKLRVNSFLHVRIRGRDGDNRRAVTVQTHHLSPSASEHHTTWTLAHSVEALHEDHGKSLVYHMAQGLRIAIGITTCQTLERHDDQRD